MNLHAVLPHSHFQIGELDVVPIVVVHDKLPILGFRIGKLAYITDMKTIGDAELTYLKGVET